MIGKSILAVLLIFSLAHSYASETNLPDRLKVALSADSYPYMFINNEGELAGLAVDYWREVARQENIQIEFIAADWPDTFGAMPDRCGDYGWLGWRRCGQRRPVPVRRRRRCVRRAEARAARSVIGW